MRISKFCNATCLFGTFRGHRLECEGTWNKYCLAYPRRCRFLNNADLYKTSNPEWRTEMRKYFFSALLLVLLILGVAMPGHTEEYPKRTINIINPFLPGGWMDLALRPVIERMSQDLGVSVITNPTPGAGGSIGYTKASQSKPDGYTFVLSLQSTLLCNDMLRDVRYSVKSFEPVASFCMSPTALAIKTGDPRFSNITEFIEYAKAHPNELSLGMSGTKNTSGAATAIFEANSGVKFKWIPFDGALAVNAALASGHVDCAVTQSLKSSGVTGLLLFGGKMDGYPNIPTTKEMGYSFEWADYLTIYAPKGIASEKREVMEKAILKAGASPEVKEVLNNLGLQTVLLTGEQVAEATQKSRDELTVIIEKGYIVPESEK